MFRTTWKYNFLPPLTEPIIFLVAIGFGIGHLVGEVNGVSYTEFIAPGIIAVAVMNAAFFENSFGSFIRMHFQRTFEAIVSTPLSVSDVIAGELLWGATKSTLWAFVMSVVMVPFGLLPWHFLITVIPLAFIGGLTMGGFGMVFAARARQVDLFNIPMYLIIIPMTFICGTFFPRETIPPVLFELTYLLPLTHIVIVIRAAATLTFSAELVFGVIGLLTFCVVLNYLSLRWMISRLVQ